MSKRFILSFTLVLFVVLGGLAPVFADAPPVPAGSVSSGAGQAAQGSSPVAAAPTSSGQQQPGIMGMLFPFVLMFGVVYFLMIRPQQKKMKDQQKMLGTLQHGDEVVTSSGILGKVTGITEKVVTLQVADNCKIKLMKSQVAQVIRGSVKDIALES